MGASFTAIRANVGPLTAAEQPRTLAAMQERTDLWSVRLAVSLDESGPLANTYLETVEDEPWGAEFGGWLDGELEPEPYFTIHVRAKSAYEA